MKYSALLTIPMLAACAAGPMEGGESDSSSVPGKADLVADVLVVSGQTAEQLFDALAIEGEFDGAYHTFKTVQGELGCTLRTPWGAPSSYSCSMMDVLDIDGVLAEEMYNGFAVSGDFDGAYHSFKRASGTLSCYLRTPWGAPASYGCAFRLVPLEVEGQLASDLFDAIDLPGDFDGAYHTFKNLEGSLTCTVLTPWGAPPSYSCDMGPELVLDGELASQVFDAMNVEGLFDGGYFTTKTIAGTLRCMVRTPWGAPASYSCSIE